MVTILACIQLRDGCHKLQSRVWVSLRLQTRGMAYMAPWIMETSPVCAPIPRPYHYVPHHRNVPHPPDLTIMCPHPQTLPLCALIPRPYRNVPHPPDLTIMCPHPQTLPLCAPSPRPYHYVPSSPDLTIMCPIPHTISLCALIHRPYIMCPHPQALTICAHLPLPHSPMPWTAVTSPSQECSLAVCCPNTAGPQSSCQT